jgi:hypothetical protein
LASREAVIAAGRQRLARTDLSRACRRPTSKKKYRGWAGLPARPGFSLAASHRERPQRQSSFFDQALKPKASDRSGPDAAKRTAGLGRRVDVIAISAESCALALPEA